MLKNNIRSGTLNRNREASESFRHDARGSSQEARHEPVSHGHASTRYPKIPSELGAANQQSAGSGTGRGEGQNRSSNGGQASLGVSGLPGPFPGVRRWTASAPAQAKAEVAAPAAQSEAAPAQAVQAPPKPFSCRAPRSSHGIDWRTRRLVEQNDKAEAASEAKARAGQTVDGQLTVKSQPATAPVAAVPETPVLTVKLASDRYRIFERIAAKENRSVKAVIGECISGCAIQVARAEAQAMRAATIASDERERSGFHHCLDFEHRPAPTGYVEIQLALVG